jgi:hypothetical protein
MIKEVAFVGYPISDVARARAFSDENSLGLKLSKEHSDGNALTIHQRKSSS